MKTIRENCGKLSVDSLCGGLNVNRSSYYRWAKKDGGVVSAPTARYAPLALSPDERQQALDHLHSDRFIDCSVPEVYATILDEGGYICSMRTMYRILDSEDEVRERRNQSTHRSYEKPELLATGPNQLWSWDITKLKGPAKWTYYYLYVILDVYSRYVVGWMVAYQEKADLAKELIAQTVAKQGITRGTLTVHADRGPSMTSKAVAFLLSDLGVTKTHSRPYTSNDNPYSEAQFKTLKYRPDFPAQFGSISDSRNFCGPFFQWYNNEHHHSGIALLTPHVVHYGEAQRVIDQRNKTLSAAFQRTPERFKNKLPMAPKLPTAVWINPPKNEKEKEKENTGEGK